MQEGGVMADKNLYINRDIRWLSFNERILKIAENPRTPLMERLKFIGIFSSNLDEFYSVRVGALHRMIVDPRHHPIPPGIHPKPLLKQILEIVKQLNKRADGVIAEIFSSLRTENISIVDEQTISERQKLFVDQYFALSVRNRLFPLLLDADLPFPYLKHITLYLAVHMYRSEKPKDRRYALIEVPTNVLPRYIALPSANNRHAFIMLDDLIRLKLPDIFIGFPYDRFEAYTIKITRDGEYELADEVTKSLYEKLTASIRQRNEGDPVRFVYDKEIPAHLLAYISEHAALKDCRIIISGGRYHNARDLISFPHVGKPLLYFEEQPPVAHHTIEQGKALIPQIEQRDRLLTFPFHPFSYVIDLLREASLDQTVVSIKMTLYRVPEDSSVINALRNAARNGKKVTLFIELQARFDEKTNMDWTEKLTREHNISLISGMEGVKVHSKICIIAKRTDNGKSHIAVIGTGNFNEKTAMLYSDHVLLTADRHIAEEVNKVFALLERGFSNAKFRYLTVSPFSTRKTFMTLIKREASNAAEGKPAQITLKLNNLTDRPLIKQLVKAAKAGVHIRLIIRGICLMETKIPGITNENIQGKAMIDRYLEHSRLIKFANDGNPRYYIGSADWMERNLDNRIEVMTPVFDPGIQAELDRFLQLHWEDTYASFSLESNTFNRSLQTGESEEPRAQQDIYRWYRDLAKDAAP
jgi:polyphosphate kinase